MEIENQNVIDVEVQQIDLEQAESIEQWYSAAQMQRLFDLNKSALRQAVFKLTSIYAIDIKVLRRGGARATEYSQIAVNAIKLLKAQKFAELRKFVDKVAAVPCASTSAAIVFVDQHNQIATNAATAADINLAAISSLKSGLLNNYREAGRAWGRQAAAELQLGFTEEVAEGIKKLQES
ncbi:hypothetical protein QUA70_12450 [Microcoleus sp. LAD1_D5]|uniref:hypothetical protein n=1 Tax=unclassified Microcoleus TaxID=2642155 RepID=UPI002FD2C934